MICNTFKIGSDDVYKFGSTFIADFVKKSDLPVQLLFNGGVLMPFNRIKTDVREKSQRKQQIDFKQARRVNKKESVLTRPTFLATWVRSRRAYRLDRSKAATTSRPKTHNKGPRPKDRPASRITSLQFEGLVIQRKAAARSRK